MSNSEQSLSERRQYFRIDMEYETVDLLWRDEEGQAHKVKSVCLDFSRGGLRIEHEFAITEDTEVSICFQADHPESQTLVAKVVRCIELTGNRFSIGLQMVD
ncbi:PilZ domain-containing protein [Thalassotalea litorea]|uniref:PilZ domain-containing protein n=1 Tax=Thalassotalea litorea TaxID=2020715 RepID=A0A5R9IQ25_9GAMM|nr:PilZ domain-containing protein [Thalassotalea litorea]TLU67634.1 PilZ domain-containing protein [Thalassotalea litorea]